MDPERAVHEQVSRLPGLPKPLDPLVAESFARSAARGSSILNVHLVNAHAPRLWQARIALAYAIRAECETPRRYRELAILRAARLSRCSYEEAHHRPMAEAAGMTPEAIDAIATWTEHRDLFSPAELAVVLAACSAPVMVPAVEPGVAPRMAARDVEQVVVTSLRTMAEWYVTHG